MKNVKILPVLEWIIKTGLIVIAFVEVCKFAKETIEKFGGSTEPKGQDYGNISVSQPVHGQADTGKDS